ncbi:MAG: cell division protein FtsH, partial [Chloroflexota bacterium]
SEDAARQIDGEIQEITVAAYERAESILRANRDKLEMLAEMLMERETLDREEFEYLMEHGEMPGDISDVFDVPSEPSEPAATEPESYDNPTDGADAGETGSNLGPAPA